MATVITTAADAVAVEEETEVVTEVAVDTATTIEPHCKRNHARTAEKMDTSSKIATSMRKRRDKCIVHTAIWMVMTKKPVSSCTPI